MTLISSLSASVGYGLCVHIADYWLLKYATQFAVFLTDRKHKRLLKRYKSKSKVSWFS